MSEAAAAASASPAGPAGSAPSSAPQSSNQPTQGPGGAKSGSQPQAASSKGQAQQSSPGSSASQAKAQAEAVQQLKELAEDNMDAVVKIKINGQVKSVSVREALKLAEKGEGADQKFQRAAQIERNAQQLAKLAQDDPDAFMAQWGIDPDKYSQARLAKLLEEQMMTPEQKRLRDLEQENKKFKETEAQRIAREKQEKEDTQFKQADQTYRNEVMEAWQGSGLPAHPSFGIEIAKEMLRANSQGATLTAKQAAANVKRDWLANSGNILDQMDDESLFQALPKSVHDKLRAYYVRQVSGQPGLAGAKSQGSPSRPGQQPASTKQTSSGKKMLSEKEYREYFEKL